MARSPSSIRRDRKPLVTGRQHELDGFEHTTTILLAGPAHAALFRDHRGDERSFLVADIVLPMIV
ncbi:MAG: hypothetical protein OXI81_19030 [Paracoccaceae bacterium]|nr:hypothetical protein [Paracoccaceae bacterium]